MKKQRDISDKLTQKERDEVFKILRECRCGCDKEEFYVVVDALVILNDEIAYRKREISKMEKVLDKIRYCGDAS